MEFYKKFGNRQNQTHNFYINFLLCHSSCEFSSFYYKPFLLTKLLREGSRSWKKIAHLKLLGFLGFKYEKSN